MTTALVLAGNSFVGRHLCQALEGTGVRVVATARHPDSRPARAACDLTDRQQVDDVVATARPDWVVQCAGATGTADPWVQYAVHVGGTLNLLAAMARHAPAARVVLVGSAAEYGAVAPEALPVPEDCPPGSLSFFGASKLAQTLTAQAAAVEWKLGILVVRPFNIIGPGLPDHYFAATLARRLLGMKAEGAGREFPIVNATATRDFVDVRDVAAAVLALLTRAAPPAGTLAVYNIASGRETSIRAVAEKLGALAGGFRAVDAGGGPSRSGISRSCGDASRLRRATSWTPQVSWERSLEDLWEAITRPGHSPLAPP